MALSFLALMLFVRLVFMVIIVMMTVGIASPARGSIRASETAFELERHILVDRTGVRLLLLHAQFRQHVDNDAWLYFKLTSQLIDPDFLHRRDC
jgi:hypothetical protein